MSANVFRLCTYKVKGFTSTGIGFGDQPVEILDVQQLFTYLRTARGDRRYPTWPTDLEMLHILDNWDIFNPLFTEIAELITGGELPADETADFRHQVAEIKFEAPITNPRKVLSAGGNYYDHMKEMGVVGADEIEVSEHLPFIFVTTPDNTLVGDRDSVVLPSRKHWRALDDLGDDVTWETELAVIIGRTGKDLSPEEALDYIAGYTIYQDISAEAIRTFGAFEMDWFNSKSADTYSPMGPWITPKEFVADPQNLAIRTHTDNTLRQNSSTNQMMYSCAEMVSYASSIVRLQPGDVIATGTCAGNGSAVDIDKLDPEKVMEEAPAGLHFGSAMLLANRAAGNNARLEEGQILTSEVEGLGRLTNPITR